MAITMRVLCAKFVLCLIVVLGNKRTCLGEKVAQTHDVIKVSSLLPSNTCTPLTQVGHPKEASLKLVHKHGPCSHLSKPNSFTSPWSDNLSTLLLQDQSRVKSIQSRLRFGKKAGQKHTDAVMGAHSGEQLGTGNYIVTVGLGTPEKQLSLVFDTGSSLTWTQCQPCARRCYRQKEPIFQPSQSSSFHTVPCGSDLCAQLESTTGTSGCINSMCAYRAQYGDGSFSAGYLVRDKLKLMPNDVFDGVVLGCGQYNQGLFGSTAGLLGLGRDPLSIVSQTSGIYADRFSYCIPSSPSSDGFLAFGYRRSRSRVKYTPLSSFTEGTQFYGIEMIGISIAGTTLPVPRSVFSSTGTIIDSGTVVTRLPPAVYAVMRKEIRRLMSEYPATRRYSLLDMCYDFSDYDRVRVPKIAFLFEGGVEVLSDISGVLLPVGGGRFCFAFIGNTDKDAVGIFGNMQHKTWEVVHDNEGSGRVGFGASACS